MDTAQDEKHLQLISIFHYVVGGIAAIFSFFPVFHLIMGIMFILAPADVNPEEEFVQTLFGWIFVLFSTVFIIGGWVFAGLVIAAGRCLAKRRRYTFCLVMAGIECIFMPFGTVLGVFTIIILMREPVKEMFIEK